MASGYNNRPGDDFDDGQYQQNGAAPRRRRGPIAGIVRGIASGIGLVSESVHHHKEKKKEAAAAAAAASASTKGHAGDEPLSPGTPTGGAPGSAEHGQTGDTHQKGKGKALDTPPSSDEDAKDPGHGYYQEIDNAAWHLDDAQSELVPLPDYDAAMMDADPHALAGEFIARHRSTSISADDKHERHELPLPVILPQRRPGDRGRGFINAYAPILEGVDIDQPTFSHFIQELNKATAPSPWINAVNLASVAARGVPLPVTIAVAVAARKVAQGAKQVHSRSKTNAFLNKINTDFFEPLGLIAVIMTWKPSKVGEIVTQATFDTKLQEAAHNVTGDGIQQKMQSSDAVTNFEWPECAPLVFPELDKLADTAQGRDAVAQQAKQPNAMKRGMIFAMQYTDKRAQAQWSADHPDSNLAHLNVKPEFHSRYADPNNPASSGSIIALLTGGAISGGGGGSRRSDYRHEYKQYRRDQRAAYREERGPTLMGTVGPLAVLRGVKKFMHEDVLYLMIANIPSDEQMATADRYMEELRMGNVAW